MMGEQQAVANILYSTQETPVELNGNVDIEKAAAEEVSCHLHSSFYVLLLEKLTKDGLVAAPALPQWFHCPYD